MLNPNHLRQVSYHHSSFPYNPSQPPGTLTTLIPPPPPPLVLLILLPIITIRPLLPLILVCTKPTQQRPTDRPQPRKNRIPDNSTTACAQERPHTFPALLTLLCRPLVPLRFVVVVVMAVMLPAAPTLRATTIPTNRARAVVVRGSDVAGCG